MPLIIDDFKKTIIIKYDNKPTPVALEFKDIDCVLVRDAFKLEGQKSIYIITKAHTEHFIKTGTPAVAQQAADSLAQSLGGVPVLAT